MARHFGRVLAVRRVIPSMECALVCLLVSLSIIGHSFDLDHKVRDAAADMVAAAYDADFSVALNAPPVQHVTVRIEARATLSGAE